MTRTVPTEQRRKTGIGVAEGLVLLAGLYLIVAPLVVGFTGLGQVVLSNVVVGLALSLLAVGHAMAFDRIRGLSWVVPVLAVWVIVSPLTIGHAGGGPHATSAVWLNNAIGGGVALIGGLMIAAAAFRRTS